MSAFQLMGPAPRPDVAAYRASIQRQRRTRHQTGIARRATNDPQTCPSCGQAGEYDAPANYCRVCGYQRAAIVASGVNVAEGCCRHGFPPMSSRCRLPGLIVSLLVDG